MNTTTPSARTIEENQIEMGDDPGSGGKTVLVFGETGSGKSSIIRLLCNASGGCYQSDNSISATSSTLSTEFTFETRSSRDYTFIETSGLSEGSQMSKYSKFCNILKLIKHLEKGGVHLLVFVVRMGRINKTMEENYNIFVNGICLSEVPVLVVVTHCENESAVGTWWNVNEVEFLKYGMTFNGAVSICPVSPADGLHPTFARIMKEIYDKSKIELPRAVVGLVLNQGWKTDTWGIWLRAVHNSVWNLYWSAQIKNKSKVKRRQSTIAYGSTG